MTDDRKTLSARTVALGIGMVVVGMQVFIIQPGFLAGLVNGRGLTEAWVGYIASGEMFGIALVAIIAAALGQKLPWRRAAIAATLLIASADLASIAAQSAPAFLLCRVAAGLGSGLLISLGYSVVGLARVPDRSFGYALVAILTYGAMGIFALPMAFDTIGADGILLGLAAMALAIGPFLSWLPARSPIGAAGRHVEMRDEGRFRGILILAAILIFFLGQGVIWPFLSLVGSHAGIDEQKVANGLTISQVAGIAGAFMAAWFGAWGHLRLLAIGTLGCIVPLLGMVVGPLGAISYAVDVTLFNGAANLLTPLFMAMAAAIDHGGPLVQRATALQMIGLATGPLLAAPLAQTGSFDHVLILSAALFLLSFMAGALATRLPYMVAPGRSH